jgi:hypothetical protein
MRRQEKKFAKWRWMKILYYFCRLINERGKIGGESMEARSKVLNGRTFELAMGKKWQDTEGMAGRMTVSRGSISTQGGSMATRSGGMATRGKGGATRSGTQSVQDITRLILLRKHRTQMYTAISQKYARYILNCEEMLGGGKNLTLYLNKTLIRNISRSRCCDLEKALTGINTPDKAFLRTHRTQGCDVRQPMLGQFNPLIPNMPAHTQCRIYHRKTHGKTYIQQTTPGTQCRIYRRKTHGTTCIQQTIPGTQYLKCRRKKRKSNRDNSSLFTPHDLRLNQKYVKNVSWHGCHFCENENVSTENNLKTYISITKYIANL